MSNTIGNEFNLSERLYIIPQDPETREALINIDRSTKVEARLKHRLIVEQDWHCNTIANAYIESMIRALALAVKTTHNENVNWNFYNLFDAHVTIKRDEDAEKEGNINIAFEPLQKIDEIIADQTPRDKVEYTVSTPEAAYSFLNDTSLNEAYKKIDQVARMELHDKYSIVVPGDWYVTAIAVTFFECLIRQLMYMVANNGKASASINFNDNIECHALLKLDKKDSTSAPYIKVTLRPGMSAKLLIKSDEATEADEDELDD